MPEEMFFYAVAKGRIPGIYYIKPSKYKEVVKPQVDEFSCNKFKRFNDKEEAVIFMRRNEAHNIHVYDDHFTILESIDDASSDNCFICGVYVDCDEPHPQCDVCKSWFHLACVNMGRDDAPGGDDDWSCNECFEASQARNRDHDPTITNIPQGTEINLEQVVSRLEMRLSHLETENSLLKARVDNLEEELKSKGCKQQSNTCIKGLKIVADANEVILKKLDAKEKNDKKQNDELLEIKKDVASLKDISHKGGQGVVWEGISVAKNSGSWVEVVRKGRKRGGKSKRGRVPPVNKYEFVADSHGRDLVQLLKGAEVSFKPGAKMEGVVEAAGRVGMSCTVVMGGTNDVSEEGVKRGLFKLRDRLGKNQKVVMVGVPHRYDSPYPYVEDMILRKNSLLKNFCDFYGYQFLSVDDSKKAFFTRHGLHFNRQGKRWLAEKIQRTVDFLL